MAFLIHSVCDADYNGLHQLALDHLFLNLPSQAELLKKKIKLSDRSFAGLEQTEKRNFLFVMKDSNGNIVGTAQVAAKEGTKDYPRYSMEIVNGKNIFLQVKINMNGASYLRAIVLAKPYRGHPDRLGKQLMGILFLFVAMHPEYFEDTLSADIEPWLDKDRSNPFINYFIRQQLNYSIWNIDDTILTDRNKLFASFPKKPFLLSDLPMEVQKHIGRPGFYSQRGLALLKQQNFHIINEVDPLDGGACVMAKTRDIPIIKHAKKVYIVDDSLKVSNGDEQSVQMWLWGRENAASFTGGMVKGSLVEGNGFMVSQKECQQRGLELGDQLWIADW